MSKNKNLDYSLGVYLRLIHFSMITDDERIKTVNSYSFDFKLEPIMRDLTARKHTQKPQKF